MKNATSNPKGHRRANKRSRRTARWVPAPFLIAGLIALALAIVATTGGTAYAIHLENRDSFCASCHTQPESQYYQQSLASNPTTLAAFHAQKGVRCIDCHSGSGPLGREVGLSQGFQDLMAYYRGHYHNPAITTSKLKDASCVKCHQDMISKGGFNNHFHIFLSRWQSIDPNAAGCVDCHTSHPAGSQTQSFLAVATVQNVCQECHSAVGAGRE